MKNIVKILCITIIAFLVFGNANAQTQTSTTILNLGANTITIDGKGIGIWEDILPIPVERPFNGETPTLTAFWKGAWNEQGIYILVDIDDDIWYPHWVSGIDFWLSDHIEMYFDVSEPQQDGGGPADEFQKAAGNWQISPNIDISSGKVVTEPNGVIHCSTFDGFGQHTREFFVPYKAFQKNGMNINPLIKNVIGFDISIADNDGFGRNRLMWSSDGRVNAPWVSCDGVGLVTLSPTIINADITYAVSFNVDMNRPINDGEFIEGVDELWLAGSMSGGWNTWNQPGVDETMKMSESVINNIYTITLNLNSGLYAYKFFKNASWNFGELIASDRLVDILSDTTINCIWSIKLPETNFLATSRNVSVDEPVSFVDATKNSPSSWVWNFGDGSGSTIQNPTHIYAQAGNYTVELTATNALGSDTELKSNYIKVSKGVSPIADFTVDYALTAVNTIINFTDNSTNFPTSWLWDFGDGKTSEFKNPAHLYTSAGTYTVSLKVTNNTGSNTQVKPDFIVVNTVTIKNTKSENWVQLLPNPSKGIFSLIVDKNLKSELSVQITDAMGKVIFKKYKISANSERIDLGGYSKGIFFIQISGDNYLQTEKMVIN